jgi:3-hydroxybutyryl-CoA dehydrogenase
VTSQTDIIGVMGAGAMGRGIVQIALSGGYPVKLWDASADACADAATFIARMIRRNAEKGNITEDEAETYIGNLTIIDTIDGYADCDIVVEAILENIDIKQKVFGDLDKVVRPDCVLASNTSSLVVAAIASACEYPERVAGFHFFNPVPLMKVVEIVQAVRTTDEVVAKLSAFANAMGHRPVVALDTPGFLVNHAGRAYSTEAFRIVSEGITDYLPVDDVMRDAGGFRMGPFELLDLTGLDVSGAVMDSIYEQFYQEPRYRPNALVNQRVAAGLYGRKNGAGFYTYEDNKRQPVPEAKAPDALPKAVSVVHADPAVAEIIIDLAKANGVAIDDRTMPFPDTLCIVTPIGKDATTTALELNLNPENVVAIDPLFGLKSRRTLMTTPVTTAAMREAAWGLLGRDAVPVTVIHDSPGFIAQRIIAAIVNIGCEIAQQRIASTDDIDPAVELGLGYPRGPLAYGDFVGADKILAISEAMFDFYGDPRYRPSAWLKRRAMLGISLQTKEG